jgi:hypothetical protein
VKKRAVLILSTMLVVAAAVFPLSGAGAGLQSQSEPAMAAPPEQIPDMNTLLNYRYPVEIIELGGSGRDEVILDLMARPETLALMAEMETKGFVFDPADADAMAMLVETDTGPSNLIGMTMTTVHDELMGAITAMGCSQMSCRDGFFQAHITNLDPLLAEVPDPPIAFNGMPYFFITTLRWVGPTDIGRVVYWRYWWFDSHHHPNWYYSCFRHYWDYYALVDHVWPWWHHWAYGWYYWRFWYFWSTWFPWSAPVVP